MEKKVFPVVNSEQADLIVKLAKKGLGPDLASTINNCPLNMNHLIRFIFVADMCKARREDRGLSIKEISSELKIPQYRLKEIEKNSIDSIKPEILDRYIEYLDLEKDFQQWMKENRDVYEGLGERG